MNMPIEKSGAVLTKAQVRTAIDSLTQAGWVRLSAIARGRSRVCKIPPEDLLQTALERLLSGQRTCPCDEPIEKVIVSSIWSIASSQKKSNKVDPLFNADDLELASEPETINEPEAACLAQKQLEEVFALFANDPLAKDVLTAKALGMAPAETKALLDIDATTYDSTLKRIARRLATYT